MVNALFIFSGIFFWLSEWGTRPLVFVVGDSISMHYGPFLSAQLEPFARYDRKQGRQDRLDDPAGANGGDSRMVLEYLKTQYKRDDFRPDYLLVNAGLHDIKRSGGDAEPQISAAAYAGNLAAIVQLVRQKGAQLIWISTTPVIDTLHNRKIGFRRYNADVIRYNRIADSIMFLNDVPVADLYRFTQPFAGIGLADHVHYTATFREMQASFLCGFLVATMDRNRRSNKLTRDR